MGLLSGLFGGGGSKTSVTPQFLPAQRQAIDEMIAAALDRSRAPDPLVSQGLASNIAFAQGGLPQLGQSTQQAVNFLTNPSILDPSSNPALQGMLDFATRDITNRYQREVLPGLAGAAVGAGQTGSTRQGIAEGLAAQGTQNAIGDVTSQIINNAYSQGLQAMLGGVRAAPTAAAMGLLPGQVLSQAGSEPDVRLERLAQILSTIPTGQNQLQQGGDSNGLIQMAGLVMMGISLFCWVGVALYGEGRKVGRIRLYLLCKNNWFGRLYSGYGQRWAMFVRRNAIARAVAHLVFGFIHWRAQQWLRTQTQS